MQHPPSPLAALLAACERDPARTFLIWQGRACSFGELATAVGAWAARMRDEGVRPGDRVALFLDNSPDFVAAYLGAHAAGAAVVLVNTQYRHTELRHILADSAASAVVVAAGRPQAELAHVQAQLPDLRAVLPPPAPPQSWSFATLPDPEEPALIAYTSGTTGRAKGAVLTHRNLAANSAAVVQAWRWTEADRLLLTLPLFHIHGLGVGLNGSLVAGAAIDLRRGFDAAETLDTLAEGQVTMFFGVPTMYTRLMAEARARGAAAAGPRDAARLIPPLRLYVSGSAPLSPQTFAEFAELAGQPILERYGMTETGMNLTNPYDGERRPGTVGLPFPGQEARVVDVLTRLPVAAGVTGEIQVRGPHVFRGYWRNPAATAEAFDAEGWFNTGDLGLRSADGYFTIVGRARELIISGGYNIYPREVEEVLLGHPDVAEAAVLGLPDAEFGEQVVAVIVAQPGRTPQPEALVEWCRMHLAGYKKPRRVEVVLELPRNALGKIQKHLLRRQLEQGS